MRRVVSNDLPTADMARSYDHEDPRGLVLDDNANVEESSCCLDSVLSRHDASMC